MWLWWGCGTTGTEPPEVSLVDTGALVDPTTSATQNIRDALESALAEAPAGVEGIRLSVRDAEDVLVIDEVAGVLPRDERLAVGSGSKLVTGLVLLRLIEEGSLAFDDTTGEVLGWSGDNAGVTLDHLGAFTSGFSGTAFCAYDPLTTLAACVDEIANLPLQEAPGAWFDYGPTHLHVAARMAEVRTGESWAELFARTLASPLGVAAPDLRYVTAPREEVGVQNPLVSGGLLATLDEYEAFLALQFHRGALGDDPWISSALVERMEQNGYPAAQMGTWPMFDYGFDYRYGWCSWLECDGPVVTCPQVSSPGAWGFTPWIDREHGYYAILAMESDETGEGASFSVPLAQALEEWIEVWLAER